MNRSYTSYAFRALVLAALAASLVGCCTREKNDLKLLEGKYNDLSQKNQDVSAQLAQSRSIESQLRGEIDSKDMQITALNAENKQLKDNQAAHKTVAPPPTGPRPGSGGNTVFTETVGSDLIFQPGRATLTTAGKSKLASIASMIKSRYPGLPVRVFGYTDSSPIRKTKRLWKDNLDLSANRAMEVTRYLWSRGIPAERIETVAMGATHFVASNATKSGRAANRRVVIRVVKK